MSNRSLLLAIAYAGWGAHVRDTGYLLPISQTSKEETIMKFNVKREDLKISDDDRKLISDTPILLSLLYDVDLLPEQLMSQDTLTPGLVLAYHRFYGIMMGYRVAMMKLEDKKNES